MVGIDSQDVHPEWLFPFLNAANSRRSLKSRRC
jgi:hypothetical protein